MISEGENRSNLQPQFLDEGNMKTRTALSFFTFGLILFSQS